jgi:hypothetical protein
VSGAPADPAAATVSPTERTRTPSRPGLRVGRRSAEPVQMHPEITGRIEEELQAVNPALQAAIAAVVQVEPEEPTDPGAPPVAAEERPYVHLDYEERVCRLLEDIRENTRRLDLRLAAEEHRRTMGEKDELVGGHLREERRTLLRWVEHWCLDPKLKSLVAKALAVGTALGTSIVGSAETMALVMELVERLLRAWVSLP